MELIYGERDLIMKHGDPVRVRCSATGRYIGNFEGFDLGLFVSAMDNSFTIDLVDPDGTPHEGLPLPSDDALEAVATGLAYGRSFYERKRAWAAVESLTSRFS
jgi:hypothetical protein